MATGAASPPAVAARWGERAGPIAAGLTEPPPLDLSLRDPAATAEWNERLDGVSLASGHVRLQRGTAVAEKSGWRREDSRGADRSVV